MSITLDRLRARIAGYAEHIECFFTEPVKVTIIVRNPKYPDGRRDCVVTNEADADAPKIIEAVRLRFDPAVVTDVTRAAAK